MRDRKSFLIVFGTSMIFFLGLLFVFGVGINNDSVQYISMHIHRDPGYPFFLWIVRLISEKNALILTGIIQSMFASFCCAEFTLYVAKTFRLSKFSIVVVFWLTLMPHVITPLFSVTKIVLSSGIMSEALCVPMYLLFVKEVHRGCITDSKLAMYSSLILSVILSLIRAQVTATILIWMFVFALKFILNQQYKKILFIMLVVVIAFQGRLILVKTYNYVFNGHFINTTYGPVNILANVLYASDRELGECIEDKQLQEVYYLLYDKMDTEMYNYIYGGDSIIERGIYLERVHDRIKFDICEAGLKQYLLDKGINDYVLQNIEADKYAMDMVKEILPVCIGQWCSNYFILGIRGVIRSVAVIHPILNIYALIIVMVAIVLMIMCFVKNKTSAEGWLMLIALLTILGISFSTAITIMCLSRYMIYGFTGFYVAFYIILLAGIRYRNTNEWRVDNGV